MNASAIVKIVARIKTGLIILDLDKIER